MVSLVQITIWLYFFATWSDNAINRILRLQNKLRSERRLNIWYTLYKPPSWLTFYICQTFMFEHGFKAQWKRKIEAEKKTRCFFDRKNRIIKKACFPFDKVYISSQFDKQGFDDPVLKTNTRAFLQEHMVYQKRYFFILYLGLLIKKSCRSKNRISVWK